MNAVTVYGVAALTFMMVMYALERRGARYVLGFAVGCGLSSLRRYQPNSAWLVFAGALVGVVVRGLG